MPLAIYIGSNIPTEGLIRISYFSTDYSTINESYCGDVLSSVKIGKVDLCKLIPKKGKQVTIKVLIKGENRIQTYQKQPGITLLEPEKERPHFSVFSSPTQLYREHYGFYYDAFVIIDIGKSLQDSTISLYNQDVREKLGFSKSKVYNVYTGQEKY